MFKLLPYAIQVFDRQGIAVMVNDTFLKMYRIDSATAYCGTYNIITDELALQMGALPLIERVFAGETLFVPCGYGYGYPNYSSQGITRKSGIFSSAVFVPVLDPDGSTAYVISIRTDLTAHKETEERLRASEETFRSMIHAIQEAAILVTSAGEILAANATLAGRLGQTPESIKGKIIFDLLPPAEAAERKASIARVVREKKPFTAELHREGRVLMSSVYPVFNLAHDVEKIAFFATDITRLKAAQDEITKSEERMRALLEGSSDMVQVLDAQGTIKYVSPSIERILGYDPALPLGDSAFKIIHPDDLPAIQQKFALLFAVPDQPLKVQCRCLHKNGTWRHIEAWAKNHLANPAIAGIVLNIRDITDHIEVQRRIETSEQKFRCIVEQSRDGIAIIDATGAIIIYNSAQETITGITAQQALGQKIWDFQYRCMTPEHKAALPFEAFKAQYLDFIRTGKAPWLDALLEVEMVRANGDRIHLQTVLFTLHINDQTAYASFNRDVTAQKNAERELRERETELKERTQLLEQKNAALRELMSQVEMENRRTVEQIRASLDQLVFPVLHRLKNRCCTADRVFVNMLEENLNDVVSGFGIELSSRLNRLTQREIELCGLIRQGITSKEIGRLLHISPRTVETHRNRIRKKLGVTDPDVNLVTFLKTLSRATGKRSVPQG